MSKKSPGHKPTHGHKAPYSGTRSGVLAVVLKGYPRLSETFIAQEILALEQAGLDLRIISLRRPTDPAVHPVHEEIQAPATYLPEYLHEAPGRVLRAWRQARRLPGYVQATAAFLKDFRREPTRNRLRRFGQACVLAAECPAEVTRFYAHFLHTPASVARYASLLTGRPWSCSAHAKDIWTTPEWEIREKLIELDWLVTCTRSGRDHLASLAAAPEKVQLVYHGLDFARLPHGKNAGSKRDGSDPADPLRLLSVGRAVEKKGYDDLLAALSQLPQGLHWRLTHIGGGAGLAALKAKAEASGLSGRIIWLGAQAQAEVFRNYQAADLFLLASRIAGDGDRDGLPNVLMESQSQGLTCLATEVSAIPELIEDGVTGRLVPPSDPAALAAALLDLARDPAQRQSLSAAGLKRLHRDFDMTSGINRLLKLLAGQGIAEAAE